MKQMRCFSIFWMILWVPCLLFGQSFDVRESVLDNGMQILTVEQHDAPTITCAVFFRTGSVSERPGITGVSHLLEHMMFKGTAVIGTQNFEAEQPLQEALDRYRLDMRRIELERLDASLRRPPEDAEEYGEAYRTLQEKFESTLEDQRQYIEKEHLDQLYEENGGFMVNAFTSQDMTGYFVRLPANKAELFLWLESDRMQNSTFREFYPERSVVREERRMSLENTPTGRIDESYNAMFWESSPYGWSVIGWPWDIENISREDIRDYYASFYAPDNAVGLFMGDFETDELMPLIRAYFERIPRSDRRLPRFITPEIDQVGEKRLSAEARSNPGVTIRYHTKAFGHPDTYPLEVLAQLLSGKTGRLYKRLVIEKELALGDERRSRMGSSLRVDAEQNTLRYAGYFEITAEAREGAASEALEKNIYEILGNLASESLSSEELEKAKNQILAERIRYLKGFFGFLTLFELGQNAVYGNWREINEKRDKVLAVTADDIRRVAAEYFKPSNRNVLILSTLEDEEGTAETSPRAQMMIERINNMDDAEELTSMISQMESMKSQIEDQEMARGIEKVLAAAYARLETLKKGEKNEK